MERINPYSKVIYTFLLFIILIFGGNPLLYLELILILNIYNYKLLRGGLVKIFSTGLIFTLVYVLLFILNSNFGTSGLGENLPNFEVLIGGIYRGLYILSWISLLIFMFNFLSVSDISYTFGSIFPRFSIYLLVGHILGREFFIRLASNYRKKKALNRRSMGKSLSMNFSYTYELGIKKSTSMEIKGFGMGKRSKFIRYGFDDINLSFLVVSIFLFTMIIYLINRSYILFLYDPMVIIGKFNIFSLLTYVMVSIFLLGPIIFFKKID